METLSRNYDSKMVTEKGLVSVIIPIYNGKHHLSNLIESLKNQTYKKIEIITVDNNSSDNSLKQLEKINEKIPIVIASNKKNEGYCGGCNKGIEVSKGEYLLFLSQDRLMKNDWIEKAVLKIEENNRDFLKSGQLCQICKILIHMYIKSNITKN